MVWNTTAFTDASVTSSMRRSRLSLEHVRPLDRRSGRTSRRVDAE
jgi:hypothetical protein